LAFQDRLSDLVRRTVGVAFQGIDPQEPFRAPAEPDLRAGPAFEVSVRLLSPLLPMSLIRPAVEKRLTGLVAWEVEKNIDRLGSQWRERLESECLRAVEKHMAFMEAELAMLETLVHERRLSEAPLVDLLTRAENLLGALAGGARIPGEESDH
jgi:hypothetical protein